jgi:TPR repeat protein
MSEHGGYRGEGRDGLDHVLLELENLIHRQADSKTPRRRLFLTKFPIVMMVVGAAAVVGVVIAFSGGTSSAPPSHAADLEGDGAATVASALHSLTEQTGERSSNQASISNPLAKAASTPVATYGEALGLRTVAPPWPPSPADLNRPEPGSKASEVSQSNVPLQQADRVDPQPIDPAHAAMLQKRADLMLASGDLSAARLILGRLAETGNGRAAYQLAQTYDPAFLRQVGSIGLTSDIARARSWYEKARDLGFAPATERLQALASSASPTVGRR